MSDSKTDAAMEADTQSKLKVKEDIEYIKQQISAALYNIFPEEKPYPVAMDQQTLFGSMVGNSTGNLNPGSSSGGIQTTGGMGGITSDTFYIGDPPGNFNGNGDQIQYVQTPAFPWANGTITIGNPIPPKVGDMSFQIEQNALCIWDGSSWKPIIKQETLEEAFRSFQENATQERNKMLRFCNLELDNEEPLPQEIQDELLIQAFRLKIMKLLQEALKK
jgi:hypothetical protein